MKKKMVLLIGSGLVATGLLVGCGHSYHSSPEKKVAHIVEEINEELELQQGQQVKLDKLKEHVLVLIKKHKATKAKKQQELRALLDQPVLDQNAILAHINAKTSMINQESPEVVALTADFYDSLNESQRAEIRKHVDKFSKRHKRWHDD